MNLTPLERQLEEPIDTITESEEHNKEIKCFISLDDSYAIQKN